MQNTYQMILKEVGIVRGRWLTNIVLTAKTIEKGVNQYHKFRPVKDIR